MRYVSASELAGIAGQPVLGDNAVLRTPVVVLDLDTTAPSAGLTDVIAALDRIVVGRATRPPADGMEPVLDALDLTYASHDPGYRSVIPVDDVDAAIAEFTGAVLAFPQSALVAAQVVRASETLDAASAIDIESLGYSTLQGGTEFGAWLAGRRARGRPLPPPTDDPVLLTRTGDELRITLNRPERRNAYGTALRDGFVEALRLPLLDDSIRSVIVDGAGPSFCAGGDLDEFGHMPDAATAHLVRTRGGAGRLVARLRDRIEFRLHGHCVGAGIEIPAFAGRVVAHPDTMFRLPEVGMGLIPGAGGTVSVPRRIGRWRALHLFVTGAAVDATQALDWGLIDEVAGQHADHPFD